MRTRSGLASGNGHAGPGRQGDPAGRVNAAMLLIGAVRGWDQANAG
ncbi:hypothetical protein [Kibdelosporangium phytohabitans]|nr:hypothetical protein [Kibdelosporangium phytohabitans]MBE1462182.1 hypothetical protein [Kibdelosporangium phytohabitans]